MTGLTSQFKDFDPPPSLAVLKPLMKLTMYNYYLMRKL